MEPTTLGFVGIAVMLLLVLEARSFRMLEALVSVLIMLIAGRLLVAVAVLRGRVDALMSSLAAYNDVST